MNLALRCHSTFHAKGMPRTREPIPTHKRVAWWCSYNTSISFESRAILLVNVMTKLHTSINMCPQTNLLVRRSNTNWIKARVCCVGALQGGVDFLAFWLRQHWIAKWSVSHIHFCEQYWNMIRRQEVGNLTFWDFFVCPSKVSDRDVTGTQQRVWRPRR